MAKLLKAGEKTTDMVATEQEEDNVEESLDVEEAIEGTAEFYEDIESTTEVEKWTESESEFTTKAESNIKAETIKLPAGWTAWSGRGVKSPEGTKYKSKGKAIMDLIKMGGSSQTIETLRNLYMVDGFTRVGLPYGLIGRRATNKEYIFITHEGHEIHSKVKAIRHLQENNCSKEEISLVDKFLQGLSYTNQEEQDVEETTEVEEDVEETTKVEEDVEETTKVDKNVEHSSEVEEDIEESTEVVKSVNFKSESKSETLRLPAGWTAWNIHGVISPEGTKYLTKGKAIMNLTKLGGSSQTIEVLRALYLENGFTRVGLPDGWIGRKKYRDYIFINPEGRYIHTKAKAIINLKENNSSKEEQSMIDQFCQGLFNEKLCMEKLETRKTRKHNVVIGEKIAEIPGWKTWGDHGLTSPDGTNFNSKARAINHLVSTGGAFETIQAIRKLYGAQGYTSDTIPKGWLGRKKTQGLYFISPAGKVMQGKVKAIDQLLEMKGTEEDQSKITTYTEGTQEPEKFSTDCLDWKASEFLLRHGWAG